MGAGEAAREAGLEEGPMAVSVESRAGLFEGGDVTTAWRRAADAACSLLR